MYGTNILLHSFPVHILCKSEYHFKTPASWPVQTQQAFINGYFVLGLLGTPASTYTFRYASKKSSGSTKGQGKGQKPKHLGPKRGEGMVRFTCEYRKVKFQS